MAEAKSSAIEFAQGQGIGNRDSTLQRRRALRLARRQNAADQKKDGNGKSQRTTHVLKNTAQAGPFQAACGRRASVRKLAEKPAGCLAAIGTETGPRFTSR